MPRPAPFSNFIPKGSRRCYHFTFGPSPVPSPYSEHALSLQHPPPAGAGPSPPSAHLRMAPTGTSCCHYLTPEPDLPRPLARNPATCSTGLHLQTPSFCRLPSSPPPSVPLSPPVWPTPGAWGVPPAAPDPGARWGCAARPLLPLPFPSPLLRVTHSTLTGLCHTKGGLPGTKIHH